MIEVTIEGMKILENMTAAEKSAIKEDLTFDNPQYVSAQQHGAWGGGSIPPYSFYYTEGKSGKLLVPRGYQIPFPHKIVSDKRLINRPVSYPTLAFKLRDTQREAVDRYIHQYKNDVEDNGVIILPTGKGKSILGLYLARKMSQRVLVVVQKDDLVDGWTSDAHDLFHMRRREVGVIKGKDFRLGKQITITTIQTLVKLPPEKVHLLHNYFGMVIVDEFHHSASKIYEMISYFPARFKIGLTATAMRNDGLLDVLYLHFGKLVYEYKDKSDDADILPVNVLIRNAPTIFNPERKQKWNARLKRPEYEKIPISTIRKAISYDEAFNTMLAKDILRETAKGKSCIVFTHEKEHVRIIEERLIERGFPAEKVQLYYGDSKIPKDVMKQRAESKEVLVTIATYAIATEGTNVKAWERAFLASTVANEKDTVQAIGRIRRTMKGKEDCLVYDYRFPNVTTAKNHGKIRSKVYKERGYNVMGKDLTGSSRKKTGRGWH